MLRKARKSDAGRLAQIHFSELNSEFLPSLGIDFLKTLYKGLINVSETDVVVFEYRRKVWGFAMGAKDFKKVFKKNILNNLLNYSYLITKKLLGKPSMIKNILETFFYTSKEGAGPTAELVVIAVSNDFHRRGVGSALINELEKKFKKKKIKEYRVSVNKKNKTANLFYRSMGFLKVYEFSLYNKQINVLVKKI